MFGALIWAVALTQSASAADETAVHLPTKSDALAFAPYAQSLLYGKGFGVETQLPGPVSDREHVDVGLNTDGSIASVEVDQRLVVSGLGDFLFKISGPARDVEALPGSASNPGLRKGAVLWQGFSSGRKVLAAHLQLYPRLERDRLPLSFAMSIRVGGRPLEPGRAVSGPVELTLTISNNSAVPIGLVRAPADPAALAPVMDRVREELRRGVTPTPGKDGIPKTVPATGTAQTVTEDVEVPVLVRGRLEFPAGSVTGARAEGARLRGAPNGTTVLSFERTLGGGDAKEMTLSVTGQAHALRLPDLTIDPVPTLPPARELDPPVGKSWKEAASAASARLDGEQMLVLLQRAMWQGVRIVQFDAYLGNPDLSGPSKSTYLFRLAPHLERTTVTPREAPHARPLTIAGFSVGIVLLLTGLALVWARS